MRSTSFDRISRSGGLHMTPTMLMRGQPSRSFATRSRLLNALGPWSLPCSGVLIRSHRSLQTCIPRQQLPQVTFVELIQRPGHLEMRPADLPDILRFWGLLKPSTLLPPTCSLKTPGSGLLELHARHGLSVPSNRRLLSVIPLSQLNQHQMHSTSASMIPSSILPSMAQCSSTRPRNCCRWLFQHQAENDTSMRARLAVGR
jgi:hypothetical protein